MNPTTDFIDREYALLQILLGKIKMFSPCVQDRNITKWFLAHPEFKEIFRDRKKYSWVNVHIRWRLKHDEKFRMTMNLRTRLYFAFKAHRLKKKLPSSEYGIDYSAIIEHLGPMPNDGKKYEIDHLVPLSYFDFSKPEHIKAAFLPQNHQWLEASKNSSKGDRIIQL